MTKKKNVKAFGLFLCGLSLLLGFALCFLTGLEGLLRAFVNFIIPGVFYCVYCYTSQKKYILISYPIRIIISFILIFLFNYWNNSFALYFVFCIVVYLLLPIVAFIKNKKYNICATVILILFSVVSIFLYWNIFFGLMIAPISLIYDLILWYNIGLREYMDLETIKAFSKSVAAKKMFSAELSLEDLKTAFDKGEISEEEYNRKKTEIINSL